MTTGTESVLRLSGIVVGRAAGTRDEAIRQVGAALVDEGIATDGYVDAMLAREAIISTYLGNGIALPHGTSEAQATILRTGLAVAQYPEGVPWGDELARLVIGLAARSDEHIAILSRLAGVLEDAELCERLGGTDDAAEILTALTSEADTTRPSREPAAVPVLERRLRIANPHGLHARPAAQLVERALSFDAEVTIRAADRFANALSITQVIALGANTGEEVTITASGDEAEAALSAVVEVLMAEEEL